MHNPGLLLAEVRAHSVVTEAEADTRRWLAANGVSGYAQNPVMWELFGYPDFFLKDAGQLLDGQYADRPALRPIADAVIALVQTWAESGTAITEFNYARYIWRSPHRGGSSPRSRP